MKTQTPWGTATVLEEAAVAHEAAGKRYDGVVQLLETREGEQLVRFGARAGGARRLSCLTLRAEELEQLEESLVEAPRLASVLRLVFG
jgi:hypothetical protein